jgi:hypothetical protein
LSLVHTLSLFCLLACQHRSRNVCSCALAVRGARPSLQGFVRLYVGCGMARPSRGVRAARSGRVAAVVSCLFLFKQMQSNRKRCRFCGTKHLSSSSVLVCAVQGSPALERLVNSNMFGHQQIHMKGLFVLMTCAIMRVASFESNSVFFLCVNMNRRPAFVLRGLETAATMHSYQSYTATLASVSSLQVRSTIHLFVSCNLYYHNLSKSSNTKSSTKWYATTRSWPKMTQLLLIAPHVS